MDEVTSSMLAPNQFIVKKSSATNTVKVAQRTFPIVLDTTLTTLKEYKAELLESQERINQTINVVSDVIDMIEDRQREWNTSEDKHDN